MVWLNTNATRLKRWFGERHIVSYTIIAANASGVAFAIRHYYKEQEDADHRRQDQEALASLDRAAAFSNARLTERSVLELESYRWKLEAEERERVQQRKKWRWLGAAETPERRWADVWMEHRCALDRNAAEMEARRIELKNLWYVSKQAWDTHPQRHNLMMDFFFDAPLNATLAHRCLHLLEDMDIARFDLLDRKYDRPTIYSFIEKLYGGSKQEMADDVRREILVGPLCRHAWSLSPPPPPPPPPPRLEHSLLRRITDRFSLSDASPEEEEKFG